MGLSAWQCSMLLSSRLTKGNGRRSNTSTSVIVAHDHSRSQQVARFDNFRTAVFYVSALYNRIERSQRQTLRALRAPGWHLKSGKQQSRSGHNLAPNQWLP